MVRFLGWQKSRSLNSCVLVAVVGSGGSRQLHIGVEEPFRPATKAHPAFSVNDIQTAFATELGIVWESLAGRRRFYARDPGNRLEFTPAFAKRFALQVKIEEASSSTLNAGRQ